MRDRLIFGGQLLFTLIVAAFLVVPAGLSITAGVTVNYFRGIASGVTLQWVAQVWELYADTIALSFLIAFATLAVTLVVGVPSAYALHLRGGRLSRIVEEIITLPLAIPGLAIALYHQPSHLWEIPLKIASWGLDYRLEIRGHGHGSYDTVLYAFPRDRS